MKTRLFTLSLAALLGTSTIAEAQTTPAAFPVFSRNTQNLPFRPAVMPIEGRFGPLVNVITNGLPLAASEVPIIGPAIVNGLITPLEENIPFLNTTNFADARPRLTGLLTEGLIGQIAGDITEPLTQLGPVNTV